MAQSSRPDTVQLNDGEWVETNAFDSLIVCCDCGLSHRLQFKLVDGKLYERWTRDPAETRRQRRMSNKSAAKSKKSR